MSRLRTKRWMLLALLTAAAFTSIALWAGAAPSEEPQLEAEQTQDQAQEQQEQNREEADTNAKQAAAPAESGQAEDQAVQQPVQAPDQGAGKGAGITPLPGDDAFQAIAASDRLELKADPSTGHFIVTDKTNGSIWRSFPNPEGWSDKTTDAWKLHLQSPFMLRYVEFNVRKDLEKESNFIAQNGKVTSFHKTEDGFRVVYELPELGFVIPVQVRLKDDYVETRIVQEGLVDEKVEAAGKAADAAADLKARLVSIRLFPFLGSETSDQENGFLLIPDGPGALIDFKKDQPDLINFYNERIYGEDWAFSYNSSFSNRQPVKMPVFGIKSRQQAVLGILQEGAEYASVYAVPSKSFSQYNWVTPEHHYRFKFFQPTDTRRNGGFFTYSPDLIQGDRATRYYFLSGGNPDYVDLAVRYRTYLMEEAGIKPLKADRKEVPLHLNLLGADTEKGFLWDSYLPLTTTDQAKKIVRELSSLGVEQMSVAYMGWQKGGYSEYGGHFPIAGGLGGNDGMRTFVDYAHSKGFPVYLDASSYSFNNTGRDGFRKSRDGLRDLSNAVIDFQNKIMNITLVSPKFTEKIIKEDLEDAKRLNVDGYLFGEAVGSFINSDYNDNYPIMRQESRKVQEDILRTAKEKLGSVMVAEGNFYTARYADHLDQMYSDYSYDIFVDRIVPFAQIALHGLVSYSHSYANLSGDYVNNYLKGIEYGAEPSFLITYAPSQDLMKSKSLNIFYSTSYKDWTEEMVSLYQHYNDALAGLRDQFIIGHRELDDGVFETEYSNGRRIVVNYNEVPYTGGGISVKANDFIATGGE